MLAYKSSSVLEPTVYLYHSRSRCQRRLLRDGIICDLFEDSDAQTVVHGRTAYVLLENHEGYSWAENAALLAHEAYHVTIGHLEVLHEESAGEETVAYILQMVTQALIEAHNDWLMRKANGLRGKAD